MVSDRPSQVKALLRSGTVVEIGGPSRARSATPIVLGFAAVYLIWGSTYLGIRYAVETIPPLLMMAVRHLTAGALVYAWARKRGASTPNLREWGYAAVAGAFLFLAGHGVLAWAEQKIPSGLAALLCATLPLWTVLLGRVRGTESRLGAKAWIGFLLGFIGVAVLIGPDALRASGKLDLLAASAALFSSFSWAVGTIYSKGVQMSASPVQSAAMQMIAGGTWLLVFGLITGEGSAVHAAALSVRSVLALAYLIVFGSIIAFTVFTWLLTVASPSLVSTYAYVNPVVAVFLGWFLASESIGWRTILATGIILTGVALVTTRRRKGNVDERESLATEPLEEVG